MPTVTQLAIFAKTDDTQYTSHWLAVNRLVTLWANRHHTDQGEHLYDTDDLIQAIFLALLDSVNTYDPEWAGFTTHLRFHVRRLFAEVSGNKGTRRRAENYSVSPD